MSKPITIQIQDTDARLLAQVALAHCSKEEITPVLCGANISIADGRVRVLATDRYSASRHMIPGVRRGNDDGLLTRKPLTAELDTVVPREALRWLAANALAYRKWIHAGIVTLEFEQWDEPKGTTPGKVTIIVAPVTDPSDAERRSVSFPLIRGNYPPIHKLIDEIKPGTADTIVFDPQMLARTRAGLPPRHPVRLTFGASPDDTDKPGPVRFEAQGLLVDGVLQPQLPGRWTA